MRLQIEKNATLQTASNTGGRGRGFSYWVALTVIFCFCLTSAMHGAATLTLQTSTTGITITPSGGNFQSSFGTMNGLAIGATSLTVPAGVALTNGALYYTTLSLVVGKLKVGDTAVVKAYVSTNFTGFAASAMVIDACPSTSACSSSPQFSALGVGLVSEVPLASGITKAANTATVGLAIFLPDNNGASAFASNASAVVTYDLYVNGSATTDDTKTLTLNNPNETVQDAVQLNLAQAPSGLSVTPASDFSMNFGNVNGLGIGPGAGLSTVAQAGGIIYSTPYQLLPVFTDMTSTTSSLKVCVSTNFAHSSILGLWDSSTGGAGTFSAISTTCPNVAFTATADRSTVTRYLGLFVSKANGATAFTGADSATLTFTMTVP